MLPLSFPRAVFTGTVLILTEDTATSEGFNSLSVQVSTAFCLYSVLASPSLIIDFEASFLIDRLICGLFVICDLHILSRHFFGAANVNLSLASELSQGC